MTVRVGTHPDVTAFIERLPEVQREVARTTRRLVSEVVPESTESIKWGRPVFECEGLLCYIAPAREHISIGFYLGAYLRDPNGFLTGEGKQLRHLVILDGNSVSEPAVRDLIAEAAKLNRSMGPTEV